MNKNFDKYISKEVNLLSKLPKAKRNIEKRKGEKNLEIIKESKMFGEKYWDGPREYGYGGYKYDGRWLPVAKDILEFFRIKDGSKILDIGSGKGFLIHDLLKNNPTLSVKGLEISEYAISNSIADTDKVTIQGDAKKKLPFKDNYFDLVLSINTLHNLKKEELIKCFKEINRILKNKENSYIVVDSYLNEEQKEIFESWVLTAEFYGYPQEWYEVFELGGYMGYYSWTIIN